jgi:hypothetical protein
MFWRRLWLRGRAKSKKCYNWILRPPSRVEATQALRYDLYAQARMYVRIYVCMPVDFESALRTEATTGITSLVCVHVCVHAIECVYSCVMILLMLAHSNVRYHSIISSIHTNTHTFINMYQRHPIYTCKMSLFDHSTLTWTHTHVCRPRSNSGQIKRRT